MAKAPEQAPGWERRAFFSVVALVAILLGVAFASSVLRSRALLVQDVEVEGIDALPREEVLEIAGLDRPRSALEVDADVMEEMLRQHTWIEGVRVWRPSRSGIHIRIQEAVPRAVIAAPNLMLVNAEGRVIDRVDTIPPHLPLLTGAVRAEAPEGNAGDLADASARIVIAEEGEDLPEMFVDGAVVGLAVSVLDAWRETRRGATDAIVEMSWSPASGLRVWLASGIEVKLGDNQLAERMLRVEALLAEPRPEGRVLVRVDARGDRALTLRYAQDAPPDAPMEMP